MKARLVEIPVQAERRHRQRQHLGPPLAAPLVSFGLRHPPGLPGHPAFAHAPICAHPVPGGRQYCPFGLKMLVLPVLHVLGPARQQRLPGAHVIKAFNAMSGRYVAADPRHAEGRQVVFHAGDDIALNADFAALIETFGFAAVYVGGLADGGRLMQLDGYLSLLHVLKQD